MYNECFRFKSAIFASNLHICTVPEDIILSVWDNLLMGYKYTMIGDYIY